MLSPRAAAALLLAAALAAYAARGPMCASYKVEEAALHARGVWRAPRLGVDAFIARKRRSTGAFEVLLVQVRGRPATGRGATACLPSGGRMPPASLRMQARRRSTQARKRTRGAAAHGTRARSPPHLPPRPSASATLRRGCGACRAALYFTERTPSRRWHAR